MQSVQSIEGMGGDIQEAYRVHKYAGHTRCVQGANRVRTGCTQGAYRVHTGCVQGAHRVSIPCVQTGCAQDTQSMQGAHRTYRVRTGCRGFVQGM